MAYRNVKKLLEECDTPAMYNFELECGYEDYAALPPIERFLTYKATEVGKRILDDIAKGEPDERTAEGCYHEAAAFSVDSYRNYSDLTDFDGWDGKSSLAVSLYETLWNWTEGEQKRYDSVSRTVAPFGAMGGDTINSVQTTLNCYLRAIVEKNETYRQHRHGNFSLRYCLQLYRLYGDELIQQLARNEELSRFMNLTHTMGNLWLVPAGYNGYRGGAETMRDYADLSLLNLLYDFDGKSAYFGEHAEERERNFVRYINFSFTWDYVEKTERGTYEVLPLCDSHARKLRTDIGPTWGEKYVLPEKEELEDLCRNINVRIFRRGLFMEAMLRIAVKYPESYKKLMKEVFLTERVYEGYGEVIKAVRERLCFYGADADSEVTVSLDKLEKLEK